MAAKAGKTAKKAPKTAAKGAASQVMTGRSAAWMAAVAASLERDTGRTLEQWVKIAKTCPEAAPKKRAAWLKAKHGLGVNRAAQIFSVAFPDGPTWDQPEALLDLLWKQKEGRAIYEAVAALVRKEFPQAIIGPRKSFVSFSRGIQFAAIIPARGGTAEMGFPLPLSENPRFEAMKQRPWAEKHTAMLTLTSPRDANAELKRLLKLSWDKVA